MKTIAKKLLRPLRVLGAQFVAPYLNGHLDQSPIHLGANYIHAEDIPGDYLEFGVFRGASFTRAFHEITTAKKDWESWTRTQAAYSSQDRAEDAYKVVKRFERRFFAFDSFDGLPEPEGIDVGSARFFAGRYDCSEQSFRGILEKNGVDLAQVTTIPGFYDASLTSQVKVEYQIEQAAVVMVDCDLYESTRYVLDFVTDLLVSGSIIIFDDWFNFHASPELGEQKACSEWLKKTPHIQLVPYARWGMTQHSFIVNIR